MEPLTKIQLRSKNQKLNISFDQAQKSLNAIREYRPCSIECSHEINPEYDLMIVVPAYNVQNYIRDCIDSILSQDTEYSYYVVIIDDGSNDRTGDILDSFSSHDNISVIHQENKGIACARNAGMHVIKGKYIMFVDSDDLLRPGAIQNLMSKAYLINADIIEGGHVVFEDGGHIRSVLRYNDTTDGTGEYKRRGTPWGKVIRSQIFEKIQYPAGYEFEDSIIGYCVVPLAEKKYNISEIVYGRRDNKESITYRAKAMPNCIDTYYLSDYLWKWYADRFGTTVAFNIQVLNQIALNYDRTTYWGEEVLKSGFRYQKETYLTIFPDNYKLEGKYSWLDAAVRETDWAQYELICKRWKYTK